MVRLTADRTTARTREKFVLRRRSKYNVYNPVY